MGTIRLITISILLLLNFLAAIYLETKMHNNFGLEIFLIILGVIVSLVVIFGMSFGTRWAWPLATILFSASLANAVFLYLSVKGFLVFSGMLFVCLLGLLISVVSIREDDDFMSETSDLPVETYEEEPEIVYDAKKAKKKKKK